MTHLNDIRPSLRRMPSWIFYVYCEPDQQLDDISEETKPLEGIVLGATISNQVIEAS